MYLNESEKKLDGEKLYEQLMRGEGEFCKNIAWLADKALANASASSVQQMWDVYLNLMNAIGSELFDGDLYWNSHSKLIVPVLNKLLNEGYEKRIMQLILGAYNLLAQVHAPDHTSEMYDLMELARRYYATTQRYINGGVLTSANQAIKWDYIECSDQILRAAIGIVNQASV